MSACFEDRYRVTGLGQLMGDRRAAKASADKGHIPHF